MPLIIATQIARTSGSTSPRTVLMKDKARAFADHPAVLTKHKKTYRGVGEVIPAERAEKRHPKKSKTAEMKMAR